MSGAVHPVSPSADSTLRPYATLVGPAAGIIALDQATKAVVTTTLPSHPVKLLAGAVYLDYARNTGAAFSILPGGGFAFAAIALVVSLGILVYYRRVSGGPLAVRLGLALILGGAIGNLVDRIRLGYVVDFIDLRWWPVFNLADSAVVVGVVVLIGHSLLAGMREAQ